MGKLTLLYIYELYEILKARAFSTFEQIYMYQSSLLVCLPPTQQLYAHLQAVKYTCWREVYGNWKGMWVFRENTVYQIYQIYPKFSVYMVYV